MLEAVKQQVVETPSVKPQPPNCAIKGNISASGKIYHVPGGVTYESVKINEKAGEKWFCSESEAEQAGWRKAKS